MNEPAEKVKTDKGSRRKMLELISTSNLAANLDKLLNDPNVVFADNEKFMPLSKSQPKEAELKDFLKKTEWPDLADKIRDWWLAVVKPSTRTPNWDFISTCTINGQKGLLLVEAKAHWNEVKENDKCGSTNKENRSKIDGAISQAGGEINKAIAPYMISISKDKCYQLSNRVAHAWWLANHGVPVVLLYLGFLNCEEMKANGKLFEEPSNWQKCFENYASKVGVDLILDNPIVCGLSEFKLIFRSY